MSWMDSLVKRIDGASTLPVVVSSVLRVCDNPRSDAQDLADAISTDPVLSAKLVRTANSAFFGLVHKVSDVRGAVVRIGLKTVRNTVLGLSVSKLFDAPVEKDGFSRPGVWQHSIAVAILNDLLVTTCRAPGLRELAGEAFLAGLVHDIGIILEDQYMSKRFANFPALAWRLKQPLHQVEKNDLGFDHQDLGEAVLKKWKFPKHLAQTVGRHHRPETAKDDLLTQLTAASEMLAVVKQAGYCDLNRAGKQSLAAVAKRLELGKREMGAIRDRYEARFRQAAEVFSLGAEKAPEHRAGYELTDDLKAVPGPARARRRQPPGR